MSCSRAECPICYEAWAAKEAHVIEDRISKFKVPRGRPIHVMTSPSSKDVDRLTYSRLRTKAYDKLESVGMIGGSVIFHPFRSVCMLCGKNDEECGCVIGRKEWYFSPHFHVIGYGWIDGEKVAKNYERSGWIVKNLKIRESVYATAMYQLSHAGVWMEKKGKKTTITWFGKLSHNVFKTTREKHSEICILCGEELKRLSDHLTAEIFGEGDPPPFVRGETVPGDWKVIAESDLPEVPNDVFSRGTPDWSFLYQPFVRRKPRKNCLTWSDEYRMLVYVPKEVSEE